MLKPPLPEGGQPILPDPLGGLLTPESRRLLDSMLDGVYIVDLQRRILFWSKGAEALTGYPAAEVVGKSCMDEVLNHIDANGNLLCGGACSLAEAIKTGQPVRKRIYPMHKAGHRFAARVHSVPVRDAAGRIVGAMEVFRDVSAEERFYARQRKFDRLVQQYISKATYDSIAETVARDLEICRDPSAEERFQALQDQVDKAIQLHTVKGNYDSVLKSAAKEGGMNASTRDLTVLFLDVVSFTHFSEQHPPDAVVGFLNQLFTLTAHIIRQHSGDIDKYIGDGVMAVFISAQDAVDAARDILTSGMPSLNKTLATKGFPEVEVRIGMSSGSVIQGDIGSADRKDMTVIGDVVNTASRVESSAEPGTFLISESTYSRLDRPAEFVFAMGLKLRGKDRMVRLFKPKIV
ncbi:MAG: PAS domain S-box protein [Elusimicrobia bacterium]|nr:PAS domain S-box protein [Elusimicrobiota bacterium]